MLVNAVENFRCSTFENLASLGRLVSGAVNPTGESCTTIAPRVITLSYCFRHDVGAANAEVVNTALNRSVVFVKVADAAFRVIIGRLWYTFS